MQTYILGIESSCDDTSAAVCCGNILLSNVIANQDIHREFGGVVPEFASRAHLQNIVPVVELSLQKAKINKKDISAIAFTLGPGLPGSLIVGVSFAKALAMALDVPLIAVDHLDAHIMSHFIKEGFDDEKSVPEFPFLCLTVSGGHTQISRIGDNFEIEILGRTIDDAAGEAFDKAAKILGLTYPGGVLIDKYAQSGNPDFVKFPEPKIGGLNFSFSGLKTSFLYHVRDNLKIDKDYIERNLNDLCASVQYAIVNALINKVKEAVRVTGIKEVAVAGGVSANSFLRETLIAIGKERSWEVYFPEPRYSTDNAAMIAVAGWYKYVKGDFSGVDVAPYSRSAVNSK